MEIGAPVYNDIYHNAIQPYNENKITQQEVFDRSENRMKEFMYKQANKKDVKLFSVFNMVAVAALPLTCVYLVNMLLGLIWIPLAIMLSLCALIASLILLFNGFQKLVAFDKRPTITFVACVSVVVAVIVLVVGIIISSKISNLAGDLVGEIGSGFGSALDSLDSLF